MNFNQIVKRKWTNNDLFVIFQLPHISMHFDINLCENPGHCSERFFVAKSYKFL